MKYIIELKEIVRLPTLRDATDFEFHFSVIEKKFFGKPEHKTKTKLIRIKAGISGTLEIMWIRKGENVNIPKILYEYSKRHLIKKLEDGTILDREEVWLTTASAPRECPFDSSLIQMNKNSSEEVEIGESQLMENKDLLKIATVIIETRDTINNIFKERHSDRLFIIHNERDILNIFLDAVTIEEFIYRIGALQNSISNLNIDLLRDKTSTVDKSVKSISLLEKYLKNYENYDEFIINVFRHINRLRQAYPIHSDTADGVKEAHLFFKLDYPVTNYSESWKTILIFYSDALKRIYELIKR